MVTADLLLGDSEEPTDLSVTSLLKQIADMQVQQQQQNALVCQMMQALFSEGTQAKAAAPITPKLEVTPVDAQRSDQDADMIGVDTAIADINKSKKLSAKAVAAIKSVMAKFRKSLASLHRSEAHVNKLTEQLDSLSRGVVPQGMKPYKLSYETPLWTGAIGEKYAESLGHGFEHSMTYDDARIFFYLYSLKNMTHIDLVIEQQRLDELKKQCSLDYCLLECERQVTEIQTEIESFAQVFRPPPGLFEPLMDEVKIFATKAYKNLVTDAADQAAKTERAKKKQKETTEAALEKAANLTPAEVLHKSFEQFLARGKKSEVVSYAKMIDFTMKPPEVVPKNEKSPGVGQGKTSKGKGKSSATAKPKGNGKKGSPPAPTKGKGKGSSKSASPTYSGKSGGKSWQPQADPKGKGKSKGANKSKGAAKGYKGKGKNKV